jgi:hypothetical protein
MAGQYPFVARASQETLEARADFELRLVQADKIFGEVRRMLIELSAIVAAHEAVERDFRVRLDALDLIVGERVTEEPHAIREALEHLLQTHPDVVAAAFRGLTKTAFVSSADARVSNDFGAIGRPK